jgi:protein-tyrosine kinase
MGLIEDAMERRSKRIRPPRIESVRSAPIGRGAALDLARVQRIQPDEQVALDNRLLCHAMDPAAVTAYKMLRTQIMQRLRAQGWSSIGVTATRAGEGKTLTSINLALSLAMNPDQLVFLVDFDLHRHCIGDYFGVPNRGGLADVLKGTPLLERLVHYGDSRLYMLLNDETIENSSERLASEETGRIVEELNSLGGIVIYDLPPLLSADDYLAFSGTIDCTLLVVSEGETQRSDLSRARELLGANGLLGVVLNKSRDQSLIAGYYYK